MTDIFTTRVGDQVHFLEGTFVSYGKRLIMQEAAAHIPWLFAIPVIGPVANWFVGRWVGMVLGWLVKNADFQLYFINTRKRADEQAARFDQLVDARANSQTAEELEKNEKAALRSFDDVVKYSK